MEAAADNSAATDNTFTSTNSDDRLRKSRNPALRQRLIDAYEAYTKGQASEWDFYPLVIEHATRRMYHLERDFSEIGTSRTVDDFAQEVTFAVYRQLDRF